jgi:hypothetical protein
MSNPTPPPCIQFVLTNISKSGNIKTLLTTCCSFGVTRIYVVGQPKFHPLKHIPTRLRSRCVIANRSPPAPHLQDAGIESAFASLPLASVSDLSYDAPNRGVLVLDFSYSTLASLSSSLLSRSDPPPQLPSGLFLRPRLLGVEIVPDDPAVVLPSGSGSLSSSDDCVRPPRPCRSLDDPEVFSPPPFVISSFRPPHSSPSNNPLGPCLDVVLLMVGNEGSGMNSKQLAVCDSFAYISQYGRGMASLNVAVALAIVLERAQCWGRGVASV